MSNRLVSLCLLFYRGSVGHSGGPCVNDDGGVVGILSRSDPTDRHRCYLVPAGQVKDLVRRARALCLRSLYGGQPSVKGGGGGSGGDSERFPTV